MKVHARQPGGSQLAEPPDGSPVESLAGGLFAGYLRAANAKQGLELAVVEFVATCESRGTTPELLARLQHLSATAIRTSITEVMNWVSPSMTLEDHREVEASPEAMEQIAHRVTTAELQSWLDKELGAASDRSSSERLVHLINRHCGGRWMSTRERLDLAELAAADREVPLHERLERQNPSVNLPRPTGGPADGKALVDALATALRNLSSPQRRPGVDRVTRVGNRGQQRRRRTRRGSATRSSLARDDGSGSAPLASSLPAQPRCPAQGRAQFDGSTTRLGPGTLAEAGAAVLPRQAIVVSGGAR